MLYCYLAMHPNTRITYTKGNRPLHLDACVYSDWARSDNRRLTGGYIYHINSTLVCWSSKKQSSIALSSTEAEYMEAKEATTQAIWL